MGFSPALEAVAIALIVLALMDMPHRPVIKFIKQQTLTFRLAEPPPAKQAPVMVKEPPVAHLESPPITPTLRRKKTLKLELAHLQAPKITEPRIELPKPAPKPAPTTFTSARLPKRPARRPLAVVRTGDFTPGSAAQGKIKRPLRQFQTGGFGAANGVPGDPTNNHPVQVASLGSFDLPSGAGHGNGTGGSQGVRGAVASAGFGNAVGSARGSSVPAKLQQSGFGNAAGGHATGPSGNVHQSGFGNAVAGASTPRKHAARAAYKPVVILSKPDPVYPAEARKLHIQGNVILSVNFEASGRLEVLRVVKGLGHGMNQAAIQAAKKMRFKPAERNGRPVNSAATIHIIFQLAY